MGVVADEYRETQRECLRMLAEMSALVSVLGIVRRPTCADLATARGMLRTIKRAREALVPRRKGR